MSDTTWTGLSFLVMAAFQVALLIEGVRWWRAKRVIDRRLADLNFVFDDDKRLRLWLRAIAFTPHHGCLTTSVKQFVESDVEPDHNPTLCGACKAQAALDGKEAP